MAGFGRFVGGTAAARKARCCITSIKPMAECRGWTLPKTCQTEAVPPNGRGYVTDCHASHKRVKVERFDKDL